MLCLASEAARHAAVLWTKYELGDRHFDVLKFLDVAAATDIEPALRTKPLDGAGVAHDRMIRVLVGIRDGAALPPVPVERIEPGAHCYRLRSGTHRFYASLTLGFSHIPAEICGPY